MGGFSLSGYQPSSDILPLLQKYPEHHPAGTIGYDIGYARVMFRLMVKVEKVKVKECHTPRGVQAGCSSPFLRL